MKYVRTDRFGRVLETVTVEWDEVANSFPPIPLGWIPEPWNSVGMIEVGDWARGNVYRPAAGLVWADVVREDRTTELVATDWTQTADQVPARAALWAPYRQLLRDVPQQVDFALELADWPERPE